MAIHDFPRPAAERGAVRSLPPAPALAQGRRHRSGVRLRWLACLAVELGLVLAERWRKPSAPRAA